MTCGGEQRDSAELLLARHRRGELLRIARDLASWRDK
jgi:hypothetical protein